MESQCYFNVNLILGGFMLYTPIQLTDSYANSNPTSCYTSPTTNMFNFTIADSSGYAALPNHYQSPYTSFWPRYKVEPHRKLNDALAMYILMLHHNGLKYVEIAEVIGWDKFHLRDSVIRWKENNPEKFEKINYRMSIQNLLFRRKTRNLA